MDIDPIPAPPEGVYSRRTFLKLAGAGSVALGASGVLAACGGSSASSSSAASGGSSVGAVGGPFNLFTWQGYDLTKPFKPWRAENNIQQTVKYINNQFDVATYWVSAVWRAQRSEYLVGAQGGVFDAGYFRE
jgi:hypothetical protein